MNADMGNLREPFSRIWFVFRQLFASSSRVSRLLFFPDTVEREVVHASALRGREPAIRGPARRIPLPAAARPERGFAITVIP